MSRLAPSRFITTGGLAAVLALNFLGPVRAGTPAPVVDIWTWGANTSGQLGAVSLNMTVPWPIHSPGRWVAVSGGSQHTLVLDDAGNVWAWGLNDRGQLGTGDTTPSLLPEQVRGVSGVTAISAGINFSLAYRSSDSTLWAWGDNANGRIGQPNSVAQSSVPLVIPVPGPLQGIAAGGGHSLLLTPNGDVYSFGANAHGQLGLGDFDDRTIPALVPLPRPATSVAAGGSHSMAAMSGDGAVYTWGWNSFGQAGRGYQGVPSGGEPNPAAAINAFGVIEVSAGDLHCLGLTSEGRVWAWGYNTEGQVGNGAFTNPNTGVLAPQILALESVKAVDAGGVQSIALRNNGDVWAWGTDQYGAIGDNERTDKHVPTPVLRIRGASAVSAGGKHSVALGPSEPTSRVVEFGTRGSATDLPTVRPVARDVPGLTDIVALSSGLGHTLALDGARRVWTWGDNSKGQLGVAGGPSEVPVVVDVPLEGAVGVVTVAARANHSFALRSDGAVWSWGDNTSGQLGQGSTKASPMPQRVRGLPEIVEIAVGEHHVLARDASGAVWGWGENRHGELGNDPTDALTVLPAPMPAISNPTQIAAGGFHSLAISTEGFLQAWGAGSLGQLGQGDQFDSEEARSVSLPRRVTAVSAGRYHSLAILEGGEVWGFGDDAECQLALMPIPRPLAYGPTKLESVGPSFAIHAAEYHSLALTVAGDVLAWGDDTGGQLGRDDWIRAHFDCEPERMDVLGVSVLGGADVRSVVGSLGAPSGVRDGGVPTDASTGSDSTPPH